MRKSQYFENVESTVSSQYWSLHVNERFWKYWVEIVDSITSNFVSIFIDIMFMSRSTSLSTINNIFLSLLNQELSRNQVFNLFFDVATFFNTNCFSDYFSCCFFKPLQLIKCIIICKRFGLFFFLEKNSLLYSQTQL